MESSCFTGILEPNQRFLIHVKWCYEDPLPRRNLVIQEILICSIDPCNWILASKSWKFKFNAFKKTSVTFSMMNFSYTLIHINISRKSLRFLKIPSHLIITHIPIKWNPWNLLNHFIKSSFLIFSIHKSIFLLLHKNGNHIFKRLLLPLLLLPQLIHKIKNLCIRPCTLRHSAGSWYKL